LNHSEFTSWPAEDASPAKIAAEPNQFSFSDTWFKLVVNQTGLHRITGAQLQAAGLSDGIG
jgi:hypothetical protein